MLCWSKIRLNLCLVTDRNYNDGWNGFDFSGLLLTGASLAQIPNVSGTDLYSYITVQEYLQIPFANLTSFGQNDSAWVPKELATMPVPRLGSLSLVATFSAFRRQPTPTQATNANTPTRNLIIFALSQRV